MRLLKLLDNLLYLPDFENEDIIMSKNKLSEITTEYILYNGSKYKVTATKGFVEVIGDTKQIVQWGDIYNATGAVNINVKSYDGTKDIAFNIKRHGDALKVSIKTYGEDKPNNLIVGGNEFMKNFNDKALCSEKEYWYLYSVISSDLNEEAMLFINHDFDNLSDNFVLDGTHQIAYA